MDTATLEAEYRRLFSLVEGATFRHPAAAEEWTAEQVLAHLTANDRLLIAVTAVLLEGAGDVAYRNEAAVSTPALDVLARAAGDSDGLVATLRQTARELVLLVRHLDRPAAATAVQTRIVDGGAVRVDGPVPWAGVLNTHAETHLPAHIDQLEALLRR